MPPRKTKKGKQPATTISERVGKAQKSKTQKKTKLSDIAQEVLPAGKSIKGALTKFKTSPSSQSVSSAANRYKVLDLDTSYVGKIKIPEKAPKPPRHPRWKHKGKESLENPAELPDDWTDSEPDLSDDDYDAQIERCQERIKDNIMVSRFEARLEALKADKAEKEFLIDSEPYGLSWPVIQRLNCLKQMEQDLSKRDQYRQLDTVRAIIRAYRYKDLQWNRGLVTYWVKDRQLCQPRPFSWDEMDQVKENYTKGESFWIEGAS
ncbi:unnamed protein product [Penicillium pancosmium]